MMVCIGVLSSAAWGQCDPTWVRASTSGPAARVFHAMAYDSDRHVTILFGGVNSTGALNDVWEWNGTAWTQVSTIGTPPGRDAAAMVYDPVEHVVLMNGGQDFSTGMSRPQTYSYNPNTREWVLRTSTPPGNQARNSHGMVYDAQRNEIVLFAGVTTGPDALNDTFVWNWATSSWVQRNPFTPPLPLRRAMGMCYDADRHRVVMFAGKSGSFCPAPTYNDTWEWDGSEWSAPAVALAPERRAYFAMAYDPRSQRAMIYGGQNDNGDDACRVILANTWAWTGTQWCSVNAGEPGPLTGTSMVYDTARGNFVMFGGSITGSDFYGDTWTLRTYCRADFNCSGVINSQDFFAYLGFFFGNLPDADFNHDGTITSQDFFDFLAAFFNGC